MPMVSACGVLEWTNLAQVMSPEMDGMYWVQLVTRIFHILGAIVLVGGVFYLRMIVAPRLRASDADGGADIWFAGRREVWAKWVAIATVLLLVTGLFNYWQIIRSNERMASSYHAIMGIKILLALAVFFIAALLAGKTALAEQLRQKMKLWLSVCLAAGVIVVILAGVLRTYPHIPKPLEGPRLIAPSDN